MELSEVRKVIDGIDSQIKDLVMSRMDCSFSVVEAKQEERSTDIYRPEREQQILDRLGEGVPEDRRNFYLSLVKKVMATSRMYQYGKLNDWNDDLFPRIAGADQVKGPTSSVIVRFDLDNKPGAVAQVLSIIGDYGFDMCGFGFLGETPEKASFQLEIRADATQRQARVMLFHLWKECGNFRICFVEP